MGDAGPTFGLESPFRGHQCDSSMSPYRPGDLTGKFPIHDNQVIKKAAHFDDERLKKKTAITAPKKNAPHGAGQL